MGGMAAHCRSGPHDTLKMETQPAAEPADERILRVLLAEYSVLQTSLGNAWGQAQQRTNVLLAVLSALAVAIGLAAQATGFAGSMAFTLVVLSIALFVGLATFIRVVQASREAAMIMFNMNRIRHYLRDSAPGSASYFMLPVNDDEAALLRGLASGMYRDPPSPLVFGLVQIPGVVAVVTSAIAGSTAAIIAATVTDTPVVLVAGIGSFTVMLVMLMTYWRRQVIELRESHTPMFPSEASSA